MKGKWLYTTPVMAVLVCTALYLGASGVDRRRPEPPVSVTDDPAAPERARAFSLIGPHGAVMTDRSFRGEWLVVFFGYTHCGDICPVALHNLSQALEALGEPAARIRVAFITLDPDHDLPELLASYLQAFGPRFVGLTGSDEQITEVEETYGAYAEKPAATSQGNGAIRHSSAFYVLDPNGRFRRQISSESAAADLAASLASAMGLDKKTDKAP